LNIAVWHQEKGADIVYLHLLSFIDQNFGFSVQFGGIGELSVGHGGGVGELPFFFPVSSPACPNRLLPLVCCWDGTLLSLLLLVLLFPLLPPLLVLVSDWGF
jgi:hypothetical protein